ncbi:MAG: C39 family peptidase [Chloroflexi bacterium]|nr:C39 family peptidase [Chloroflexota bacterium]
MTSSPRFTRVLWFAVGALAVAGLLLLAYQIPPVKFRLEWRLDSFSGIVRGWIRPDQTLPTPASASVSSFLPLVLPTSAASSIAPGQTEIPPTPAPSPTALPASVSLPSPTWEKQDWNNCGPATLALSLRFHGWEGDQFVISDLLKPERGDKNVNIEELVFYVRTQAGWLNADFRVGGTIERLKSFIAAGFPVIVEKGFVLGEGDGGGGWAGHYLLLTGYDDAQQTFVSQDTNPGTGGPDRLISYEELDEGWREFNRVYMYLYLPRDESRIQSILGQDVDLDHNRAAALEAAQAEIESDPQSPYSWFNLGTNLVYFERYGEASQAFDNALALGLPWRFTRYQFGPYIAYFNQGRFQDVVDLAEATLFRTYKAEESLLWRGWAKFRLGDLNSAIVDWREALQYNPNYQDAQYALEYVGSTP